MEGKRSTAENLCDNLATRRPKLVAYLQRLSELAMRQRTSRKRRTPRHSILRLACTALTASSMPSLTEQPSIGSAKSRCALGGALVRKRRRRQESWIKYWNNTTRPCSTRLGPGDRRAALFSPSSHRPAVLSGTVACRCGAGTPHCGGSTGAANDSRTHLHPTARLSQLLRAQRHDAHSFH